jgi:adenosylcobinamide-GDP ribazoletransferase
MKNELRIFFTALMFYTRIPCPKWVDHDAAYINKATRYFPFIGYIVGLVSGLVYIVSGALMGSAIATVLSLLTGILLTGAFHEDGLADVCDGFGGGWTKTKILEIMKDSRVGAYGVIGLIVVLMLKFIELNNSFMIQFSSNDYFISAIKVLLVFICYHSLARLTAITIVFTETYAREDADSKAKPIANMYTYKEVLGSFVFGISPLLVLAYIWSWHAILVLVPLFILRFLAIRFFNKWIEGYTGDCLGAVEQVAEALILLSFIAISNFLSMASNALP